MADLLRTLVGRDLGLEVVDGADRTRRVVVKLLTWEDYVSVALDEVIAMGSGSGQVQRHLVRLLEGLLAIAPVPHREPVEQRLAMVGAATPRLGANPPSAG